MRRNEKRFNKIMNKKDKEECLFKRKGDYVDNNELLRFMREFIVSLMEESIIT